MNRGRGAYDSEQNLGTFGVAEHIYIYCVVVLNLSGGMVCKIVQALINLLILLDNSFTTSVN